MKGISNIIGTVFFLLIAISTFSMFIFVINEQSFATGKSLQASNKLVQHSLFLISYKKNITYLAVTSPVNITYIIYPGGTIKKTDISIQSQIPIENITGNQKWVIIITNQGTWYNVSNVTVPVFK